MAMADKNGAGAPQDEAMQALIGKELRTLYDSVLVEPIPDRIVELLIKLDDLTGTVGKRPVSGQSNEPQ